MDFSIEGRIINLERRIDVRDEIDEIFVEYVGEKAVSRSLLACGSSLKEDLIDRNAGCVYISSVVALRATVPDLTSGR